MTYEERSRWFCEQCRHGDDCGYKTHNKQGDCIDNEAFMYGWEKGKEDTLAKIRQQTRRFNKRFLEILKPYRGKKQYEKMCLNLMVEEHAFVRFLLNILE